MGSGHGQFFYTLWYSETVKSKVAELGKNWDIFTCSRGDADYFFEFSCYKGGHKIREFRVDYPDSRTPEISINQGGPLPGEPEVLVTGEDPEPVLRAITEALGITVFHTYSNVKCYLISDEMNTWYQALSLYEE